MTYANDQSSSGISFIEWKRIVDRIMRTDYGIDTMAAGIDDDRLYQHWNEEQPPQDFVQWFAAKYDLTAVSEWGWYAPKSRP